MVTHSEEIAQQAKRIIRMKDGKIVSDEKKN
jgi:ABC-type lipoprotein export system ATPase subunit